MYNRFDWHGRILEVCEVRLTLYYSRCRYRLALDTTHTSRRDIRHNVATMRLLYAPFFIPF